MSWEADVEKSQWGNLHGNRVFKTQFPVWNSSFKDLSSIKKFQNTLEHKNRNMKNTRTKTQRNNQQIRRNMKEQKSKQQIRNIYTNNKSENPN